jgi:hypothetical protein
MSEAGSLSSIAGANNIGTVSSLKITGTMDARDFRYLRDNLVALKSLDLSEVVIIAYQGSEGTANGYMLYPNDEIPLYAFYHPERYQGNKSITNIVLPNSAKVVGEFAFMDCSSLMNVKYSDSIEFIGDYGFSKCISLKEIRLSSNIRQLGNYSFSGCTNLETVILSDSLRIIGDNCFDFCKNLKTVEFSSPLEHIGHYAFWQCVSLKEIVMPSSVTSMGGNVFAICTSLERVVLPDHLTSIRSYTFAYNYKLKDINIPASTREIGSYAFIGCESLQNIIFPDSLEIIREWAFTHCLQLDSIAIPSSVNYIGYAAFAGCSELRVIMAIREEPIVMGVDDIVFNDVNTSTCKLIVPFGTKSKYEVAEVWKDFYNISEMPEFRVSIKEAELGHEENGIISFDITTDIRWSILNLPDWLEADADAGTGDAKVILKAKANSDFKTRSVVIQVHSHGIPSHKITIIQLGIPLTVQISAGELVNVVPAGEFSLITRIILTGTIDARDFKTMRDKMTGLIEIDISGAEIVEYVGEEGTRGGNITYHAKAIPFNAFHNITLFDRNNKLEKFIFPVNVTRIEDEAFFGCESIENLIFPDSLKFIGNSSFAACTSLISVTMPDALETISFDAFRYCTSLRSITIPKLVRTISPHSFNSCSSLESVTFKGPVTTIGDYAFAYCTSLIEIEIPETVTKLGVLSFGQCPSLRKVTIPASVTTILSMAFMYCESLNDIYVFRPNPINLQGTYMVFYGINKETCTLHVPKGSKSLYASAAQWSEFFNIAEMPATNLFWVDGDNQLLKIFPNPSRGFVNIDVPAHLMNPDILIYNTSGALVKELRNNFSELIDLSGFTDGVYFIVIKSDETIYSGKIILTR